ncbi:PLD nuclease N-terminal domain-containing protein [Roseovarius nanhaiticus]|uniref:Phospholipase_D-nuclease N-terminal n=1 Tax=Roseovarius nanhaiticus TaxID=573024 RepID=A0A1N7H120_9RHOB|nr:PLD nuclease N-terminal domain-containing protein [Roseovarius nanhaiticus]SEL17186.1 Phospholipase_D-nuclease N-terminal [Roseovarius nanhaiticus]SIS18388.1 Phospholipase_D-nuclease N-terminal [Roseovarius nanhaiticus]
MVEVTSLGGLIVLICDVWAIVSIFGASASTGKKAIWIAVVILLPIAGFLAWLLFGPRATRNTA